MPKSKKQLWQDLAILAISIGFAVWLVHAEAAASLVSALGALHWLGIFIAGIFFTSVFTTAPAIAILGSFAQTVSLPTIVILGGLGAAVGDYLIFRLVKDRMSADLQYLMSFSRENRLLAIFKTNIFRFFMPFLGALILASPFPNELGVAMLGLSKIETKAFLALSFILNGISILIVATIARALVGL